MNQSRINRQMVHAINNAPYACAWGVVVLASVLFMLPQSAAAYQIVNSGAQITGDFALEPAKLEITSDPGDTITREISLTNRSAQTREFTVTVEDAGGTEDPTSAVKLFGDEKGPYSLKDITRPEINTFTLQSGQKIILPITITIPWDAEPGGKYGSVLIASGSTGPDTGTGSRTVSRLGALFFVRVNGDVVEEGMLEKFGLSGNSNVFFTQENPVLFDILFRNTGNVHLNPYGILSVTNIFGTRVGEVAILPYYALPQSLRGRQVSWDHGPLIGRYVVTLELNRGYDDLVDTKTVTLWFIPWKPITGTIVVLFALFFVVRKLGSTFEIRRKE